MLVKQLHNYLISGLIAILSSTVAHADYDAADLKKLFTNKQQRAQIDALRSGNSSPGELKKSNKIKLSGYVTRSDGKGVVWVNDKNTLDSTSLGDIKVYQSSIGENKKVTVSADGKSKQLKPGEIWYKETGKIVDNY